MLAAPAPITRELVIGALVVIVGSTLWLWPHLLRWRDVPDRGDPIFSAWRIARFAHQLTTDPRHLFDGNIFHPLPLTLTYSDPTVLHGLLGTPLILAGFEPLIVANLLFFLAFPACGLAFFFAAWRLTLDVRAAVVAGMAGAWYPFHGEHYSHLELQWFMFVPLAIVALLRVIAHPSWPNGAWLGALIAAQWLASMYFGLQLVAVLIPFVVVTVVAWRVRPSLQLGRAVTIAIAVALPAVLFTAIPYWMARDARGERTPEEVQKGSALVSDYLRTHRRMASHQWRSRVGNTPERELFPGISTLALAGIAAPWASAPQAALISSGVAAFDWSLGFNGVTYGALFRFVAPLRGMRVPARFSVMVGSILILLGAFGTRRLLNLTRSGAQRTIACAVLAGAVLFDLRLSTNLVGYWSAVPSIYARVTDDMVLAELPRMHETDSMYFSTAHWAALLGGYSPVSHELNRAFDTFPDAAAVDTLRRLGATHLTYNCAFERSDTRCRHTLDALERNASIELLARERWYGAEVRLYGLR
jgi:hypothetical protein